MTSQHTNGKYEYLAENPNFKSMPIIISLIIGAFFAVLNETLLNIALTTLMGEFQITLPTVQWMATGFMLVMGIIIPASAMLMQWFSTRQLFIGTMIIFTVGTTICAIAPNFSILLVGRLIQAVGTGLLLPIISNVFLLIFPPERRGKVMGFMGLVLLFAPAIGPTLSGIIVEHLGWRYLFIVVIPFALLSIFLAYKYVVNVFEVTKPKIDIISLVYSTIGFGGTVYGFSSAGDLENGFLNPAAYIPIVVGLIALLLFALRQFKLDEPIMNLRAFAFPMFTHGIILVLFVLMAMFASEIILPLYMQGPLALSPSTAGLVLLPGSILSGLMSPVMGALFDKFGPKVMMIPATLILSGTMFMMSSRLSLDTPVWFVIAGFILLMVSVSAIMMPAQTNALNQLPKQLYPHGTAIVTTLQPVAGAIGVSIFVSIMSARQENILNQSATPTDPISINEAMIGGMELVYFIAFIMAAIAFIMSLFVYRAQTREMNE
ncbi:MDR family MFS transporter [Gracilibacillus timonensis]|uniref:MDR family MFS transporter n=1 Tax=Gracilibacillus timonensis TaxID=1816696 RepID=UPI000825C607